MSHSLIFLLTYAIVTIIGMVGVLISVVREQHDAAAGLFFFTIVMMIIGAFIYNSLFGDKNGT